MRVHLVAGARPNFMKVAPVHRELSARSWCDPVLVHTGQHYDRAMSDLFLAELGLGAPDIELGAGSGTHAEQTAAVLVAYERALLDDRPDLIVVVGDVNSTFACTLAAAKLGIPVAHLEAGLRSGDRSMPEELNRLLTDALADILWTPSDDASAALRREGVDPARIELVGNIMIDSLEMLRPRFEDDPIVHGLGLDTDRYVLVTLHRPSNVDDPSRLREALAALAALGTTCPVLFPMHPRTAGRIDADMREHLRGSNVRVLPPLGPAAFLKLEQDAALVITDSGGVQEETTYFGVPCATMRPTTERPVTISQGTNRICGWSELPTALDDALSGRWQQLGPPPLWDGATRVRVADAIERWTGTRHVVSGSLPSGG